MQKRISLASIIAIIGVCFLSSCTYDTLVPEKINPDKTVSFTADIQPIFTANCINCHPSIANPDLRVGNSYSSLITGNYINKNAPSQSLLYTVMTPNGTMNMAGLSASQLVLLWIQQGAKNN
jgi:hypothetical protein